MSILALPPERRSPALAALPRYIDARTLFRTNVEPGSPTTEGNAVTTEAQKRNIDNLKSRVGDLKRQLWEAEARLFDAQCAASQFPAGSIWTDPKGTEWKVIGHRGDWLGQPEPVIVQRKKDGSWSTAERRGYMMIHYTGAPNWVHVGREDVA